MSGRGPGRGKTPPGSRGAAGGADRTPKPAAAPGGTRDGAPAAGRRPGGHGKTAEAGDAATARTGRASHPAARPAVEQAAPETGRAAKARPEAVRPPAGGARAGKPGAARREAAIPAAEADVARPEAPRSETRAPGAEAPKGPGALRRSRPVRQTRSHAAKPQQKAPAPGEAAPAGERGERIAKWLARAGVASRRDAEKLLAEGKVRVNNAVITHPATFVDAGDLVQVGGALVEAPGRARLWRYHKPDGLVTTHRDPEGRDTVFAALPPGMGRVVSVGRLDLNSEGLLLLTNDGGLARRLEMPANGWLRRYRVRVYGVVDEAALAGLAAGIEIDGVRYGPIEAGLDSRKGNNGWITVGLREGRNREVRRVMEHLGLRVTRLIRVAYGPFQLGLLTRGSVEEVTAKVLREQIPDL